MYRATGVEWTLLAGLEKILAVQAVAVRDDGDRIQLHNFYQKKLK